MDKDRHSCRRTFSADDANVENVPDNENTGSDFTDKQPVYSRSSQGHLVIEKVRRAVPAKRPLRFFDLPAELRNEIYALTFPMPETTHISTSYGEKLLGNILDSVDNASPTPPASVLRTNRQFRAEASAYMYTSTTFAFTSIYVLNRFLRQIGTQVRYLRHIEIVYCACFRHTTTYRDCMSTPETIDLDLAGHLKSLTIGMHDTTDPWQRFENVRTWYHRIKKWVDNVGEAKGDNVAVLDLLRVKCFNHGNDRPLQCDEDAFEKEFLSDFREYIEDSGHVSNQMSVETRAQF